jgi:peptidoglycan/LPS O-acetylase OafA/YrhL
MKDYNLRFSETSSTTLNLIRVVAIHNIVIVHGMAMTQINTPINLGLIGTLTFPFLFLISGFLISHSIFSKIEKKTYDFRRFFINRVSRIIPPLFLGLTLTAYIDGTWAIFMGFEIPSETYNIPTFFLNILLLNNSAFGIPSFGSSFQLWTLPMFFWTYLFFGWVVLGLKSTKKRYSYFIILGFFTFMIVMIYCGPWYRGGFKGDITLLFTWICGVIISILMNRMENFIQKKKKSPNFNLNNININNNLLKSQFNNHNFIRQMKLKFFLWGGLFFIFFFLLGPIFNIYLLEYILLLISSFFFLLIYTQYTSYTYPEKFNKILSFMASYSYSIYIIHYSIFNFLSLFFGTVNNILLFLIGYIISNLLSIGVASITERRYHIFNAFLLRKLKLKD